MASHNITIEDIMDKNIFYCFLADSYILPYLFEPQCMAKEMQREEAKAVAAYARFRRRKCRPHQPTELLKQDAELCSRLVSGLFFL